MDRIAMINIIGLEYLISNTQTGEFDYSKALNEAGIGLNPICDKCGKAYKNIDIRMIKDDFSLLILIKDNFKKKDEQELKAYVVYEKKLTSNKIIAILANASYDRIKVWFQYITDGNFISSLDTVKSMDEYIESFSMRTECKQLRKIFIKLNQKFDKFGITKEIRLPFIATCLLALKNNFDYKISGLTTKQINALLEENLGTFFDSDIKKTKKLAIISNNVLKNKTIEKLKASDYKNIFKCIEDYLLPFLSDKNETEQFLYSSFGLIRHIR